MPLRRRNIFLTILVLMLFLNTFTLNMSRVHAVTQVSVEPSDQTVGQPSLPLPTPAFPINITVDNVVDLYAWQIVLYYNSTLLNFNSASLPPGHVFDGKGFTQLGPTLQADSKGQYLFIGAMLQGSEPGFSGSGVLCQIKFVGQARGTSSLRLDIITDPPPGGPVGFDTSLLDSNLNVIPISIANGQVTVVSEVQKPPSSITIDVDRDSVPLGSNVTVSGDINVTSAGVTVTIFNRAEGSATWSELARVTTDATAHYVYPWNTTGYAISLPTLYELKSSWLGDVDYEGAESGTITVTVSKKTSTISLIAHPINVTAGSSVEVSGAVAPRPTLSPSVTISFRLVGGNWAVLQQVQTGTDGNYTFSWTTGTGGSYELMASWPGDIDYEGAESSISAVEVTGTLPGGSDIVTYLPYIIALIAIVAIVVIAVYFLKFRKR